MFCALKIVIVKMNSSEPTIDAILNGVPEEEREHEARKMFWTAVFTSWVSPYTVWSHNFVDEMKKQLKLKNAISSQYFLFVSNATCGLYYKTFRIIIYNRNDSTIVEPVL